MSQPDKLWSVFFPSVPFNKNGRRVAAAFSEIENPVENFDTIIHEIQNYSGNNNKAKNISDFLKTKISDDLIGAYVHGSVATSEEISYSDFDGFIILRNEIFRNAGRLKNTAMILKQSEKIMFEMDPLQHHGWFILTENDLKNYPEYYFPHELLNYSKCLFGENKITIYLNKSGFKTEFHDSFNKMALGILKKLDNREFLKNYYSFKNLLSEFMLLPSFYLQAKSGNGIFKKFSFEKVKNELQEKYNVMDEISALRTNWNYHPPSFYRSLKNKPSLFSRIFSAKNFSESLPASLKNKFDDSFIQQMKDFIAELKINLSK
ncbi:MAG: hypothetical protein ABIT08_01810 [Bacteroidia bacterium]